MGDCRVAFVLFRAGAVECCPTCLNRLQKKKQRTTQTNMTKGTQVCHERTRHRLSQKETHTTRFKHMYTLLSLIYIHTHTLPNLERSSVPVQMAPPCVYSEGSYWVTADICSGDGAGGVWERGKRRGAGREEGLGRSYASVCSRGDSLPEKQKAPRHSR